MAIAPAAPPSSSSVVSLALRFLPLMLCLLIYRYGLAAWFQQDDFVWLGLDVHGPRSLLNTLLLPTPHGTLRPWSDRGFFLLLKSLFGLDPLPFHLTVFAMQFANLALLGSIVRRLTGSKAAGLLAPILWVVNPVLVLPMVWISGVYQVMGALCFLGALRLFVLYADTARARYLAAQWLVFLVGLGVIESIVVYPLMAVTFAILYAPTTVRHAMAMLPVSFAFVLARLTLAPAQDAGPYALHLGFSLVRTLFAYWQLAAGHGESAAQIAVAAFVTASLLVFALRRGLKRDYRPLLFLAWFILPLAPVLPLRDHVTGYYLMIPFLGIAALAAYAVTRAWNSPGSQRPWTRAAVTLLTVGYILVSIRATEFAAHWWYARSKRVQVTFDGVAAAHAGHPGKVIVLADVDNDLFWSCVIYRPFRLAGATEVYLAPGSGSRVTIPGSSPRLSEWMLSSLAARTLKDQDRLVVLQLTNGAFVDITNSWSPPVE